MTTNTQKVNTSLLFGSCVAKITFHYALSYLGLVFKLVSGCALLLSIVCAVIQVGVWTGIVKALTEIEFLKPLMVTMVVWKTSSVFGNLCLRWSESDLIDFLKYPEKLIMGATATLLVITIVLSGYF